MNIIHKDPPNIEEIKKAFAPSDNFVFTYGNDIYAPHVEELSEDLIIHEEVHSKQQQKLLTPAEWWNRYIADKDFRINQELEAYQVQYSFYRKKHPHSWAKMLQFIASDMAGPAYGNMVSFQEAVDLITNQKNFRTETNFNKAIIPASITVCSVCGTSGKQLFRLVPKEKGKHKQFKAVPNTGHICIDCRGKGGV